MTTDSLIALIEREKYIYGEHPEAAAFNSAMDKAITIIRNHPMPNVAWCIEHYPNDCKCNMGGVSESANSQSGDSAPAPPATMEEAACYESEIIEKRLQREISVIAEDDLRRQIAKLLAGLCAKDLREEMVGGIMCAIRPYLRTTEPDNIAVITIKHEDGCRDMRNCDCPRTINAPMPVSVSLTDCAIVLKQQLPSLGSPSLALKITKAVLDAAGVKYVE